jgi:hypothetical protein
MTLPIGHLLVEQGVLTEKQCAQVLEEQALTGRPFGEVAEEMFGVCGKAVEKAWAEQYSQMAEWIDPAAAQVDPAVLGLITRRQAWQFRILPVCQKGDTLTLCTTKDHLVRAVNFANTFMDSTCYFVLADPDELGNALMRYFPIDGMSRDVVRGERLSMPPKPSGA